jgi:aspartate aminotransferase-like enzyme
VKRLRVTHGITVAGGQDHTKGKMIRIGHMGAYDLSDIYVVLGALEECTQALGGTGRSGAIDAARRAWESA